MKSFSKLATLTLLALLSSSAGCKKGTKNITPLPGYTKPPISGPITPGNPLGGANGNNGSGRPLPTDSGGSVPQDIIDKPKSTDLAGQTDREVIDGMVADREHFKANTVYFEFDKASVKASEKGNVTTVADFLKSKPEARLAVEGHCDERGTEEYNRSLGERRALSVREMLLNMGIAADRVVTRSFGEDKPSELGHDEAAWGKNRRGEFILLLPPASVR